MVEKAASVSRAQEPDDPILHAVFGDGLRVLGDSIIHGQPYRDLKVVAQRATLRTSSEVDALIETVATHFEPSVRLPSPGMFFLSNSQLLPFETEDTGLMDVAAVLVGKKPAALVKSKRTPKRTPD